VSTLILVSPALAAANTGNWHTAFRWSRMLAGHYEVRLLPEWRAADPGADALVALHARRSARSIDAWATARPGRPLIVVLTGTDLYRDIGTDANARRSLAQATRLVVLQERGRDEVPVAWRDKCVVIVQSAPALRPAVKSTRRLGVVMAGHLRAEKDPLTFMRAVRRLHARADLRFDHVGAALDPSLADAARALARDDARYRWHGGLGRPETRQRIKRAHLLVNASVMEGGAQVVIEAVQSGTAVLASRIGGHVGLLGADHPGLFQVGDDAALAALLERARDDARFIDRLLDHGRSRAPLFDPGAERASLLHLIDRSLENHR